MTKMATSFKNFQLIYTSLIGISVLFLKVEYMMSK